ncbi:MULTISPECIES: PepSY domain-containing protein [Caldisericum]|uniref:Peptidase M4 n=1 Tax=Caldisericum exile TaxID=693075 RepID=A0A2J6WE71_9BACT|nr:MAG: peptidase M4 [Caldisericum exile]
MKKKILVALFVLGLLSSMAFVGRHFVMAGNTPSTQAVSSGTSVTQSNQAVTEGTETKDEAIETDTQSGAQEPNYVGSIKVTDTNAKDEASESSALQGLAKISQSEAEASALAKVPGTVVKTTLDNENGYLVYAVEVKDAQGKVFDVKVDAGNGTVLATEASDGAEEKATQEEVSKAPDTDTVQEEVAGEH